MDIAESLFKWITLHQQKNQQRLFSSLLKLDLDSNLHLERLRLLQQAINGTEVRLYLTDDLAELSDSAALVLPREMQVASSDQDNFKIYLYWILFYQGTRLTNSFLKNESNSFDACLKSALAAPKIHHILQDHYSGFAELLKSISSIYASAAKIFIEYDNDFKLLNSVLESSFGFEPNIISDSSQKQLLKKFKSSWMSLAYSPLRIRALLYKEGYFAHSSTLTTIDAIEQTRAAKDQPANEVNIKTLARPKLKNLKPHDLNPLSHVFEKLLTADEYQGGSKTQDGSDQNQDHSDALNELTLNTVAQTSVHSETYLKSQYQMASQSLDYDNENNNYSSKQFSYHEWFSQLGSYKKKYCLVHETVVELSQEKIALTYHAQGQLLKNKLASIMNEPRWQKRQKDGSEFDVDALVRWHSQKYGAGPIDQRIYLGRKLVEQDLAILILLDSSLSTEAFRGDRAVLTTMKDALTIVGQGFAGFDNRFAVATFNSYARNRCHFKWIKQFKEDWSLASQRLGSVKPEGFTRIGPALRHALFHINKMKARRKLVLLLSDAKPSDYDYYEGVHGIGDVSKAIAEMYNQQVIVKCIAVAQEQRSNLVQMFGSGQYKFLAEPSEIALQILEIFSELMRKAH